MLKCDISDEFLSKKKRKKVAAERFSFCKLAEKPAFALECHFKCYVVIFKRSRQRALISLLANVKVASKNTIWSAKKEGP